MRVGTILGIGLALVFVGSAMSFAAGHPLSSNAPPAATVAPPTLHTASPNGAPHSSPVPAPGIAPKMVSSHWWAGSYLTNSSGTSAAEQVSVQITVPAANISSETRQFYYVLLSVWDNAGSYDQIGISNTFGVWGMTYSYTTFCASAYYYNPDFFNLTPGATYTFTMIFSGSTLYYYVFQDQTFIGGLSADTGGTAFNVSSFYSCDGYTYYDFTDYEEVYYTHQVTPDFSFLFAATQVDGSQASMTEFETSATPAQVDILVTATTTTAANEPFELLYTGTSNGLVYLPTGTASYDFTIGATALYGSSTLEACQKVSSGWGFTSWAGHPAPPFAASVVLHISSTAGPGTYLEYLYAYNDASHHHCRGEYTFLTLEVVLYG